MLRKSALLIALLLTAACEEGEAFDLFCQSSSWGNIHLHLMIEGNGDASLGVNLTDNPLTIEGDAQVTRGRIDFRAKYGGEDVSLSINRVDGRTMARNVPDTDGFIEITCKPFERRF